MKTWDMNRRDFCRVCIGAAGMCCYGNHLNAFVLEKDMVRDLFQSQDPEVMQLAEDVFQNCIVSKVLPPEPPFEHNWLIPGGKFRAQWIYDTPFVVDLLSLLPGKEKVIRGVFQNFWDFQTRWNKSRPEYAHDMIQNNMWPGKHTEGGHKFPLFSQIPILAWGVERVFRRNGDEKLLSQSLTPLERFHEWYWRERDVTNIGLVTVGTYSGNVREAHFEGYDHECSLDGLELTAHPTRKGEDEGAWYGNICVASNTAHLVLAERSLERLAKHVGNNAMAVRRRARIEKAVSAARKHMWDEEAGTFLCVHRDTMKKIRVATCGSWMPLWAEIPTKDMAKRMAEVLNTSDWQTPLPLSTVSRSDGRWRSDHGFRGGAWPAINYSIASGLAAYGHRDLAADITDKMVAHVIRQGISEYYDSISGKPLGVRNLGMVCVILTMMLDGLCRKHSLEVRKT